MKFFYIICAFFLINLTNSTTSLTQAKTQTISQTTSQANWIKQIQRSYDSLKTLQFNFQQSTYVASIDSEIKKTGQAQFKRPGQFKIEYLGQQARLYMTNAKKFWVYQLGDRQVQEYQLKKSGLSQETLGFLLGLGKMQRDFKIKAINRKKLKELKLKKQNLYWLKLRPKSSQSKYEWYIMGFNVKNYLAERALVQLKSGNRSFYVFDNIQVNLKIEDSVFKFKKKGVKKIKRRL